MLDGLFSRGFAAKCKSSIKLVKARIDMIRRKRNAMQKFLKKDISDLLANGLDVNAYGRAEGLLVELNLSSCYDLVEQFCDCILKQISVMQSQRECPEECRGAVASLIFAAARFADLPELRDLRQLFAERYGNSLESFLNEELAEKMAAKHPTREKKLQLMRDIAKEFSIKWDSKAFEQKVSNPPASVQGRYNKRGSFHDSINGYKLRNETEDTVPKKDIQDVSSRGRRELTHDEYKSGNVKEDAVPKKDNRCTLSNGRRELTDDGYKLQNERCNGEENTLPEHYNGNISSHTRVEVMRNRSERTEKRLDHIGYGGQMVGPARVNGHGDEKDHHRDDLIDDAKPKPRSVRRHLKPPPGHDSIGNSEQEEKRTLGIRKEDARRGPQALFDDDCDSTDEEDKMMDKLLLHYSKKKPLTYEPSHVRGELKTPPTYDAAADTCQSPRYRIRDEAHFNRESSHPPARAVSLPPDPTTPTEGPRTPARASSFQPDGQASHVHPKLPDYDGLAARIAALRGT